MVARGNDLMIPVKHSVEDGERQPAHGERYHDGQQHDVDSFGFTGPVLIVSHLVHHVVSPFQAYIYLEVANKYKTEWAKILQHQEESCIGQPMGVRWKFIKAHVFVLERVKCYILERLIGQYLIDEER